MQGITRRTQKNIKTVFTEHKDITSNLAVAGFILDLHKYYFGTNPTVYVRGD